MNQSADHDPAPPTHTRAKGRIAEDKAAEYLLSLGYRIVTRNYQTRDGEIDCIAEDPNGTLVFVEVKSAYDLSMGHPFYWVTRGKQRKLAIMARRYLAEHSISRTPCRFDVIALVKGKIDHLRNAFLVG
jgi:putative endonuclease